MRIPCLPDQQRGLRAGLFLEYNNKNSNPPPGKSLVASNKNNAAQYSNTSLLHTRPPLLNLATQQMRKWDSGADTALTA
jgi:hypothetical protein